MRLGAFLGNRDAEVYALRRRITNSSQLRSLAPPLSA
jgi:hypothetical protein